MSRALALRQMLPTLRRGGVVARTPPATKSDLDQFEVLVMAAFKIPGRDVIADPALFVSMQRHILEERRYSTAVIALAFQKLVETEEWLPAKWAATCEAIVREAKKREREEAEKRADAEEVRRVHEQLERQKAAELAELRNTVGEYLAQDIIERAYQRIGSLIGEGEQRLWVRAAVACERWAIEAAKFMATFKPAELADDEKRAWVEWEYYGFKKGA
ncbi:MAG TPA: hypothetical protein VET84_03330 [Stellaceae bacterium]|nr:hypothetical protein [Stellaceae bacterium]